MVDWCYNVKALATKFWSVACIPCFHVEPINGLVVAAPVRVQSSGMPFLSLPSLNMHPSFEDN